MNAKSGASTNDAVRKTLIFSAILIAGGIGGCIASLVNGDAPPMVMGAIAAVCGVLLAILSVLARRKTRS
ncbi:hypothetical protein ACPCI1_25770 [Streptomyces seoulensis]|uniref:hypothetical protein n=1 Tax=Streptomyces seoulensis TaxID=73044 RepID=UPI003C2C9A06